MIDFKNIPDMMRELKTPYVRVMDSNDVLLYTITDCKQVDQTIRKLETFVKTCKNYRTIFVKAANEKHYAGNFRGCYEWEVLVNDAAEGTEKKSTTGTSADVMTLSIQLETLKLNHKHEAKMRELEEKYEAKNKPKSFDPIPYIPLLGKIFGMEKDEIAEYMQMAGGNVEQQAVPAQLQGKSTNELSTQMTPEEIKEREEKIQALTTDLFLYLKHDKMIELMSAISPLVKKVGVDKVCKMIDYLNKNPNSVNTLLAMIP